MPASFHDKPRVVQVFLVVTQWGFLVDVVDVASRGAGDGVSRRRVPFHRGRETGVDVRRAFRDQADLQATAAADLGHGPPLLAEVVDVFGSRLALV